MFDTDLVMECVPCHPPCSFNTKTLIQFPYSTFVISPSRTECELGESLSLTILDGALLRMDDKEACKKFCELRLRRRRRKEDRKKFIAKSLVYVYV